MSPADPGAHPSADGALPPGSVIGILGGGQLGRMLCIAAAEMGLRTHVLAPEDDPPAAQTANRYTQAAYDDRGALRAFARTVDAVTIEFENVPAASLTFLDTLLPGRVRPQDSAAAVAQDRLAEKKLFVAEGLGAAPFAAVDTGADLSAAVAQTGLPAILKTRREGYDGKGQRRLGSEVDIDAAAAEDSLFPAILEGVVPFTCELSVIAARGADGSFAAFDPVQNIHQHGILHQTLAPAHVAPDVAEAAVAAAGRLMTALGYVGVMATEFFLREDGSLIVNEIAPRVHNSGHWTREACAISQFAQQIRAVAGWPLGDGRAHADAIMLNLIGSDTERWQALTADGRTSIHLYGKHRIHQGRKMGHAVRLFAKGGRPDRFDGQP